MRRLSLAVLSLAMLIAGCTSPTADVDAAETEAAPDANVTVVARPDPTLPPPAQPDPTQPTPLPRLPALNFSTPVALPLAGNIGAGEPNIAALADGTLFVTAPVGLQMHANVMEGAAYLWRSEDGGATWEMLRGPDPGPVGVGPFCSCDADVVTSPDGWVYYSDWWDGNYMVERSGDGGDTWEASPVTTREAIPFTRVDRQWLVAGEGGFLGLFYSYFASATVGVDLPVTEFTSGVHAVFSDDRGATWSQPVVVVARENGHGLQIAHPRMLPDGTLVMPYGDTATDADKGFWRSPSEVKLAVSTDNGATWQHKLVAAAPEGFDNLWAVQADVDATGAIHVGWAARVDDETMGMFVATSRDAGDSWTEPLALRAEGLNFLPWVAAMGNGTVGVGWYGSDTTGDPTKAGPDATWHAWVAQSVDGGEAFVVQRVTDEPAKTGAMCPRGASCGEDRELLDYVSLAYTPDGTMHYAFARSDGGTARSLVASTIPLA